MGGCGDKEHLAHAQVQRQLSAGAVGHRGDAAWLCWGWRGGKGLLFRHPRFCWQHSRLVRAEQRKKNSLGSLSPSSLHPAAGGRCPQATCRPRRLSPPQHTQLDKAESNPLGENPCVTHTPPSIAAVGGPHQGCGTSGQRRGQTPARHSISNLQHLSSQKVICRSSPKWLRPPSQTSSSAGDPSTYLVEPRAPTAPSSGAAIGPSTPWCFLGGRNGAVTLLSQGSDATGWLRQ